MHFSDAAVVPAMRLSGFSTWWVMLWPAFANWQRVHGKQLCKSTEMNTGPKMSEQNWIGGEGKKRNSQSNKKKQKNTWNLNGWKKNRNNSTSRPATVGIPLRYSYAHTNWLTDCMADCCIHQIHYDICWVHRSLHNARRRGNSILVNIEFNCCCII